MQGFYTQSITWELDYNLESEITLSVRHRNAAFRICYDPQILAASSSVLEQHRKFYNVLYKDDPDGESREVVERRRKPFEELMTQMALNQMESTCNLHSYLYPPWFILEAGVAESSSHIQPHFRVALSRQEFSPPGEYVNNESLKGHLSLLLNSKLNKYSSRQVQVLDQTSHLVPSKVLARSKILADAEASPPLLADIRICHLHGLIIDNDEDVLQHYPLDSDEEYHPGTRLVGLLLTYIENKGTLEDLAPWSDCTNEDRLRWSTQIQNYVKCLHAADVVWGDTKPENVLVDTKGDAWLIDFGGSYTRGWVDEDKQETVEGDLQGVQRINDWLHEWSRQPVTRIR
ncbi:uncharacterized protein N7515_006082 [Penicillium bovifimosum]|uniref:Protein kinase domain-containing protein n=1 Tax=Penicillium bovifimosum TaxID=126998 RepID=A0A9W9GUD6_9EURO|nr:uncharacterized protein N7515_006082 [Penicillium bovifimosum]KAJ5130043.1 hypothetical protein N7515_006082 [Penicillium bovifimosum]